MDMTMYDADGAAWLSSPVMLESSRMPDYGKLTPEQYAYATSYWVFWYEADHRYGLPTLAFFVSTILVFAFAALISRWGPAALHRNVYYRRTVAFTRYIAYKSWRIPFLGYHSPSLGVILLGLAGSVFFLAMTLGPQPYYWPNTSKVKFGSSPPIATRAGWMSIACLPFVLVLAAKENPISLLTRITHEELMVFHRWISWAMFVLALVHTFPFIIYNELKGDMNAEWKTEVNYWTGVVAILAQAWLQFMSIGFIRNKFYEVFKALHLIMAALFFVFLFIHCDFELTSWDYLIAAASIYAACLFASWLRTWAEHGIGYATIEPAHSGATKVTIPTTSPWTPGQHIFVRFLTGGLHGLTAHPFTICSLPIMEVREKGKHPVADMVFYIKPRGGFTGRLGAMAKQQPGRRVRVLLDGTYGGMKDRCLSEFDQSLLMAGGSGAGFTLPIMENFLRKRDKSQRLHVVVAFRTEEQGEWYENVVSDMLDCACELLGTGALKIDIYMTDISGAPDEVVQKAADDGSKESDSESGESKQACFCGHDCNCGKVSTIIRGRRPDLPAIVAEKVAAAGDKNLALTCCGPASMLYDVQNSAAKAQLDRAKGGKGELYLYTEQFGW